MSDVPEETTEEEAPEEETPDEEEETVDATVEPDPIGVTTTTEGEEG